MIDDVDYLLENSVQDSMIIYVDSSLRNKQFYPNANEYTIQLQQPFRNVYGFEVIEGAIPNTMYNIDAYNNDLFMTTVVKPTTKPAVDPQEEFRLSHTASIVVEKFNQDDESFLLIGQESDLATYVAGANPALISKHRIILYKKTISGSAIVKRTSQIESEFYFFAFQTTNYAVPRENNQNLIDILDRKQYNIDLSTMEVVYYDVNYVDPATLETARLSNKYIVVISNYRKSLTIGNYDVFTITADLSEILNPLSIEVEPTSTPPKKENKMLFFSPNYILLNAAKGRLVESLGFDTNPPFSQTSTNYTSWKMGDNYLVYGGVRDLTVNTIRYQIVSPGLTNLLGERFCILRIKELEDHLYGSFSYMNYTPGIGMFKMAAATGGITNLRFDYMSLVRKPFHPIGKLDKLTLRFETARGNLYDFKNVNHQLMFVIKFLVPSKKEKFSRSILNPNYDPNIMEYLSRNRTMEYKEDSDDEEDEEAHEEESKYRMYQKQLDDLDYSTSEDEGSSSEEDA